MRAEAHYNQFNNTIVWELNGVWRQLVKWLKWLPLSWAIIVAQPAKWVFNEAISLRTAGERCLQRPPTSNPGKSRKIKTSCPWISLMRIKQLFIAAVCWPCISSDDNFFKTTTTTWRPRNPERTLEASLYSSFQIVLHLNVGTKHKDVPACVSLTEKCSPGACTQKDSLTSRLHFLVLHASASVMSHFFYWLRPPLPARSIDYKDMNDWCCLQLEGSCPECSNTEIPILTKRGVNTLFKLIWDLAASGHLYYHLYCVLLSFSILLQWLKMLQFCFFFTLKLHECLVDKEIPLNKDMDWIFNICLSISCKSSGLILALDLGFNLLSWLKLEIEDRDVGEMMLCFWVM